MSNRELTWINSPDPVPTDAYIELRQHPGWLKVESDVNVAKAYPNFRNIKYQANNEDEDCRPRED